MDSLMTLRERAMLTRTELADRVGVGYQRVWAWETGRAQPQLRHALRLAAALGVTQDEIVGMLRPSHAETGRAVAPDERSKMHPQRNTDRRVGPRREDDRILAALGGAWLSAEGVAARLRVSTAVAYQALWRAESRGVVEHRHGGGYRVRGFQEPQSLSQCTSPVESRHNSYGAQQDTVADHP
jgi:DNA-binding XRE family transcriptional regulator